MARSHAARAQPVGGNLISLRAVPRISRSKRVGTVFFFRSAARMDSTVSCKPLSLSTLRVSVEPFDLTILLTPLLELSLARRSGSGRHWIPVIHVFCSDFGVLRRSIVCAVPYFGKVKTLLDNGTFSVFGKQLIRKRFTECIFQNVFIVYNECGKPFGRQLDVRMVCPSPVST